MHADTADLLDPGTVPGPVFAPLVLEPLHARLAESVGFRFGYLSGGALGYSYAVSEALLTLTELCDAARRVVQRSGIGLIVDGGVGFGDPVHMHRTIVEVEATGAVAIEIEDQVAPKRVSHHRGIEHLVPTEDMVARIEAAVAARRDPRFRIIARTGAVADEDFESALVRLAAYRDAGADLLMLMPEDDDQVRRAKDVLDAPLATLTALDSRSAEQWRALGMDVVIDPFTAQVLAYQAIERTWTSFQRTGSSGVDRKALFATYKQLPGTAGLDPFYAIEDATTERPPS